MALYCADLTRSTPGFYLDEVAISYNAHTLGRTGADENGVAFPLYPLFYKDTEVATIANPVYIYALGLWFRLTGPGILAARLFSALLGCAAALLLGLLARNLTGHRAAGVIVALATALTPWLFETSRLVFEVALYPVAFAFLLWVLHRIHREEHAARIGLNAWTLSHCALIALGLALVTYTYSTGRLLGPLLALGLLCFTIRRAAPPPTTFLSGLLLQRRWLTVIATWLLYALTLVPLFIYNLRHPGELTRRFSSLSYATTGASPAVQAAEFLQRYLANVGPRTLLLGDPLPRHHLPGTSPFLIGLTILALAGVALAVWSRRDDPWWRFMLFALLVSPIPVSLTAFDSHALMLIPFPVFLLVFTAPALAWLLNASSDFRRSHTLSPHLLGLSAVLTMCVIQAIHFQYVFHRDGPGRGRFFDDDFPAVFRTAQRLPDRPLYLADGPYPPAYIYAYWYGLLDGMPRDQFVHLPPGRRAPVNGVVISTESRCSDCTVLQYTDSFALYVQR